MSVYGTGSFVNRLEVFLGSTIRISWLVRRLVSPSPLGVAIPDLPGITAYKLGPGHPSPG